MRKLISSLIPVILIASVLLDYKDSPVSCLFSNLIFKKELSTNNLRSGIDNYSEKKEELSLREKLRKEKKSLAGKEDDPFNSLKFRYDMLSSNKEIKNKSPDLQKLRSDAIKYAMENFEPANDNPLATSWSALGPGNIGGRIRSIVIHPSTTSHILIGAVAGGVWKTTNGGLNWYESETDLNPISISTMAYDPSLPTTVYAGTGEGWGNSDAVYGGGVYKSTDFGDTWSLLASTSGASASLFRNVMKIYVDASGNIYAATRDTRSKMGGPGLTVSGGLFLSTNGGTNWAKISSTTFTENYFTPTDVLPYSTSEILYAVNNNGITLGGIYRTTNGGTNWTLITSGLPTADYRRISFAQDPVSIDVVYAVFQSTDVTSMGDGGLKGIYKSTNRGVDWTALGTPPKIASTSSLSYLGTQGWYDNVIAVDPFSTTDLYVGGVDMMKSSNGGTNWFQLTYWHSFYGTPVVHADHHVIAFDPITSGVVYSGNDGGIYKSTNSGVTWTSLNNGLPITQFYSGAISRTGTAMYGGTQDNGHLKLNAPGSSDWTMVVGGDGGYSAVDQTDSSIAYEEYVFLAMEKTTNSGVSWAGCTSGLTDAGSSTASLFIAPFAINPDSSRVLIAGSNRVWVTDDRAGSWTAVSDALLGGVKISAVTISSVPHGLRAFYGTTDGKVFVCDSLNITLGTSNTWLDITPATSSGAWVRRIVPRPSDKNHILLCYAGYNTTPPLDAEHIYYSTTSGGTWTDISFSFANVPVHSAVFDGGDMSTFYVGSEIGVYRTTNTGTTWSLFSGAGMPAYVPVDELVMQKGTGYIMAFTHGRGAFLYTKPLPVQLVSFSGVAIGNSVTLSWVTSSEINNSGFEIQRLKTGEVNTDWVKVGFVVGSGNTNEIKNYSFEDNNLTPGNYTYRLKQIDYNGNYEFHGLNSSVNIGIPGKFVLNQNYPNPFNPETVISFEIPIESKINITVYDITGRLISKLVSGQIYQAGVYQVSFNAGNIPSGVYFYRLESEKFTETKRMVKIK
ncbi:MAG TPA: hypothetical protein DIS94_05840 [Bacteroidetes bacterium]|nr:hypothetical protein [Bacteroidota bacterium]